jgi:hypothetical protein
MGGGWPDESVRDKGSRELGFEGGLRIGREEGGECRCSLRQGDGDGMMEETVESERDIAGSSSRIWYPVSSACGQGVVQIVFWWSHA